MVGNRFRRLVASALGVLPLAGCGVLETDQTFSLYRPDGATSAPDARPGDATLTDASPPDASAPDASGHDGAAAEAQAPDAGGPDVAPPGDAQGDGPAPADSGTTCPWSALLGAVSPASNVFVQLDAPAMVWTPRANLSVPVNPTAPPLVLWSDAGGAFGTTVLGTLASGPPTLALGAMIPLTGDAGYAPEAGPTPNTAPNGHTGLSYTTCATATFGAGFAFMYLNSQGTLPPGQVRTYAADGGWNMLANGNILAPIAFPPSIAPTASGVVAAFSAFVGTVDAGVTNLYTASCGNNPDTAWPQVLVSDASVDPSGPPRIAVLAGRGTHSLLIVYADGVSKNLVSTSYDPTQGVWTSPIAVGGGAGFGTRDVPSLASWPSANGAILVTRDAATGKPVSTVYTDSPPAWSTPLAVGPTSVAGPLAVAAGRCGPPIAAYADPVGSGAYVVELDTALTAWSAVGSGPVTTTASATLVGLARTD